MDIRVLRYFLAVAREENITRAAETLHIAQPSLSKQLIELEQELGKQLLIRSKKKITLTEEGVLLRQRAEEILSLVEKTRQEITSDFGEISGELFLGGHTAKTLLEIASLFQNTHKNVQFHFYSGDATDILEKLDHGNLDFATILQPVDTVKYDFIPLPDTSQWGVIMSTEDPLADTPVITPDILKHIPLILHQRIGLQQEIAHWAQTDLEALHITATYNVVHGSPIFFVQSGLGYFLTTRDMLPSALDASITFKPLEPSFPIKYALVWKKHSVFSKVAQAFLKQVKQTILPAP